MLLKDLEENDANMAIKKGQMTDEHKEAIT